MNETGPFTLYSGDGTTIAARNLKLPLFRQAAKLDAPEGYIAERGLRNAVNAAIALGQPLLVTGDPGTGKTQLAGSVAYEMQLPPPLVFHTKTTSTARDLFYQYDALLRFRDAQLRSTPLPVEDYIQYNALGLAILLSRPRSDVDEVLPKDLRGRAPTRSVVLVDEIDKAPRDLPNDVLFEVERMSFIVEETRRSFAADPAYRPILVLTSNSEKNLPDAFLRRCVYYHIQPPDRDRLKAIAQKRLELSEQFSATMLDVALDRFEEIRRLALRKTPATAELLGWLRILESMKVNLKNPARGDLEALALSYSVLVKNREDLELLTKTLAPETGTTHAGAGRPS